jgi:hypothetical protein
LCLPGKEERRHEGHGLEAIVGVRAVREAAEVDIDHLLAALATERSVMTLASRSSGRDAD